MAVSKSLLNMDTYFKTTTGDKIIINDLSYYNITDVESINKNLMTVYDGQTFSTLPVCDCGATKGVYNKNKICSSCSTKCVDPKDKIDPLLWFKALSSDMRFINPFFWAQFRDLINTKFDYIRWMCDPRYNPPTEPPAYLIGVKELMGGVRDYRVFVNKIEDIINYFINHSAFKAHDKNLAFKELLVDYKATKNDIFSDYLPVVNKKVFVMENTTMGSYTNLAVSDVIDSVMLWVKTVSDKDRITDAKAAVVTSNIISKLAAMYSEYYDKYLFKKSGSIRKHNTAARSPFTARAVIVALASPHSIDEIYIPWSIGVTLLRPHLINKLVNKKGYTHKKASSILFSAVKLYNPLLDELMNEIINETKDAESGLPGIPCVLMRNPSLLIGSLLYMRIARIKKDPMDTSISLPILACKSLNADFDGDALNIMLLLDNDMAEMFKVLKSFYSVPDLSKPCSVSGNLSLFSPSNNIIANYLSDKKEQPELDTIEHLL